MPAGSATLVEIDGKPALRFERVLTHPPERVWRALTDPEEQAAWHPTPARFEPRVGGRVEYVPGGPIEGLPDAEVTDYDPPRLLGYWWTAQGEEPNHLRFEIRPHDEGALLILLHSFEDRFKSARDGAGWHLCLDSLADRLEGGAGRAGPPASSEPSWQRLNSVYQEEFGIPPEQATPPNVRRD